ncbi:MAG: shikimate kinase [Pelovirga sp.]
MSQPNIILTGFMGTGKSTTGRALAQRLELIFIDTDQLIEERTGSLITDIFAQQGETVFRRMESEIAQELAGQRNLVIATGGGFFTNPDNVSVLESGSHILCLTATAEEIFKRVKKQGQIRPLLQDPNPLARINELLREREKVYQQFPQVATSNRTTEQIVDTIIRLLR